MFHDLPDMAGKFKGALLIMGGARCVWDDARGWEGDRMAVNDIGAHYKGTLRHWCSLHPEYFPGWLKYREGHNYQGHVFTHSVKKVDGVQVAWHMLPTRGGSSGLFATIIACLLGYERIVLAGIPMDGQGHYFDDPAEDYSQFGRPDMIEWAWAKENVFQGRVKSMSGKTRALLGAP